MNICKLNNFYIDLDKIVSVELLNDKIVVTLVTGNTWRLNGLSDEGRYLVNKLNELGWKITL